MSKFYRQYKLRTGHTSLTTWLEDDKRITVGTQLTLKDDDVLWTVEERYNQLEEGRPQQDWKVGGLA